MASCHLRIYFHLAAAAAWRDEGFINLSTELNRKTKQNRLTLTTQGEAAWTPWVVSYTQPLKSDTHDDMLPLTHKSDHCGG